ncbi:hypothetical protein GCM10029992_59470 [Glycomyces albus]
MATLRPAPGDGVFPEDFYSTTNFDTQIRLNGGWIDVDNPEMDCGIVVSDDHSEARTLAVSDVRAGELVVCGGLGVRVIPLPEPERDDPESSNFEFMASGVSSERPQALQVRRIAERMREVKARGEKILWVGGPAIVHTGAGKALEALIDEGYVDVLFAGNALAAHDIESSLYGTSLGVDLDKGHGVPHGHEHHIRAINKIRSSGSIADAVSTGVLRKGIMHSMVKNGKQYVLVGSVRDDGPLPDVYTDVIEGQRAMRSLVPGSGSRSWWRRCCIRSRPVTCCRPRCRW